MVIIQTIRMMKKQRGLVRNRFPQLQDVKSLRIKKQQRFKNIGKGDQEESIKERTTPKT